MPTLTINGRDFAVTGLENNSEQVVQLGEMLGPVQELATVSANVPGPANSFTVATVPDAEANTGRLIWVTDGNAGEPCPAISDGLDWLVVTLGTAIAGGV